MLDTYIFNVYDNYMIFEWDEDKNKSNIAKHGLDFELARYVLADRNKKSYILWSGLYIRTVFA